MRRTTPPRERRGGTCPPARPGGSYKTQGSELLAAHCLVCFQLQATSCAFCFLADS